MNELISVIVPVYNVEKYIEECISSIINQTYKNLEVIIVNDGSKDNSLQIVKRLAIKDNRIIIIEKENGGLSSARNAGLKIAKGNLICFIDSDDYLECSMIEKMYNNMIEYNADLSVVRVIQDFSNNKYEYFDFSQGEDKTYLNTEGGNWLFYDCSIFHPVWNKLYKKELIDFIFEEKIKRNEDILFNGKYLTNCNSIIICNEPLYYQRQRKSSLCHSGRNIKDEIKNIDTVISGIFDYISIKKVSSEKKEELIKYINFRLDILYISIVYDNNYKDKYRQLKEFKNKFPFWRFNLEHNIKSLKINKRYKQIKLLSKYRCYFLLSHFIDFGKIIRKILKKSVSEVKIYE